MTRTRVAAPEARAADVVPLKSWGDDRNVPSHPRSLPRELFALLRPRHWLKNGFVLVPLLLTPAALTWGAVVTALSGVAAFCAVASAVYVMNDYRDREADRLHPTKRHRPLAARTVPVPTAFSAMVILLAAGFALGVSLSIHFAFLLGAYFALNVGYSMGLKNVPIVDVLIVAFGFVLRVEAGATLVGVTTTEWITIMTWLLAMWLALGKRRDDLANSIDGNHRSSLVGYNKSFLDSAMTAVLGALLVTYLVYTTDATVMDRMGSEHLFYTTPIVLAGIMRYLQLLFVEERSTDPMDAVLTDRVLQGTIAGWALCFGVLLYS